jgi:hypothetical protein
MEANISPLKGVDAMTQVVLNLPDELAQRAQAAGILNESGMIEQLFEEAIRRYEAGERLRDAMRRLREANASEPITEEDIEEEIRAVRAERKGRDADRR